MHNQDQITSQVYNICKTIVESHIEYEADFFDSVWDHFWRIAGCDSVGELAQQFTIDMSSSPVYQLGAGGKDLGLDSESLLLAIGCSSARLKRIIDTEPVDYNYVTKIVLEEAARINASSNINALCKQYAVPMLAKLIGVEVMEVNSDDHSDPYRLYVEWCDGPDSKYSEPISSRQYFDISEVEGRFRTSSHAYTIYVDETVPLIKTKQSKHNLWDDMEPRHRILLCMILSSLGKRSPLPWDIIAKKAFGRQCPPLDPSDERAVKRCMSELNSFLDGIIKNVIKSEYGMKSYAPYDYISYCWIRSSEKEVRYKEKPETVY